MKTTKKLMILFCAALLIFAVKLPACAADYSSLVLSNDDITLIAKAVKAEAENENYLIKTSVCSMILNRLCDSILASDVYSSLHTPGAFLFAAPSSLDKYVSDDELYEYRILVKNVYLHGIDPTCGALFCLRENDPEKWSLTVTLSVDGLIFCRP